MTRTAAMSMRLVGLAALVVLALGLVLTSVRAGWGSGEDGGAATGETRLVSTYADGAPRETASGRTATDGSLIREGQCELYYPNGQLRWRGVYANGVLDLSKPQTWWNEDGSINRTSDEGPVLP